MADQDEIYEQLSDDIEDGIKTRRSNDREVEKFSLKERIEAAKKLFSVQHTPFIRVGFKKREV